LYPRRHKVKSKQRQFQDIAGSVKLIRSLHVRQTAASILAVETGSRPAVDHDFLNRQFGADRMTGASVIGRGFMVSYPGVICRMTVEPMLVCPAAIAHKRTAHISKEPIIRRR
jgi:hypothetical protein